MENQRICERCCSSPLDFFSDDSKDQKENIPTSSKEQQLETFIRLKAQEENMIRMKIQELFRTGVKLQQEYHRRQQQKPKSGTSSESNHTSTNKTSEQSTTTKSVHVIGQTRTKTFVCFERERLVRILKDLKLDMCVAYIEDAIVV
jgi:hypothetical protein